jgi:hypothetical protein
MPVSDEDLDELVERAAEEIRHAREAGKHPVFGCYCPRVQSRSSTPLSTIKGYRGSIESKASEL